MRFNRVRSAAATFAALLLVSSLARASSLPFTGTLTIEFDGLALPIPVVQGSGVAIVNGSGGGLHLDTLALSAGVFDASHLTVPITDPAVYPINGVSVTVMNGAGTIAGGAGVVPLFGFARLCLFGPCPSAVANLNIPLSVVGAGGSSLITGSVNMTTIGAPWTTGTAALGTLTRMGAVHGLASGTSSTAQASGVIRLVTPIFVSTNINADTGGFRAFAIMTLHFVPEPATLALTSGGLALLAAAGRARLRRR